MRFEILAQNWVTRSAPGDSGPIAVGPRLAVLPNGEVCCTCMDQEALGRNDFVPMLYRSTDHGETWHEDGPVWPHLQSRWSIFANISGDQSGNLFLFGSRTPITERGEPFWSDATQGLKQNELCWAVSDDAGRHWTDPNAIRMPIPGSAEAPGAMRVLTNGRWIAPYSPYNTLDPSCVVQRNQALAIFSDDEGRHWRHSTMLWYDEPEAGSAEAWIVELADGRLLGTGWHLDMTNRAEYPNAYALSTDHGATWSATQSTGILGQSTALAALPDGRALFIYNQRKHGEVGVWLALVRPSEDDFGIACQQIIWRAETPTQSASSGEHAEWTDFSFGEPSITVMNDGTLLAALWCTQPSGRGICYVRLKLIE